MYLAIYVLDWYPVVSDVVSSYQSVRYTYIHTCMHACIHYLTLHLHICIFIITFTLTFTLHYIVYIYIHIEYIYTLIFILTEYIYIYICMFVFVVLDIFVCHANHSSGWSAFPTFLWPEVAANCHPSVVVLVTVNIPTFDVWYRHSKNIPGWSNPIKFFPLHFNDTSFPRNSRMLGVEVYFIWRFPEMGVPIIKFLWDLPL